MTKDQQPVLTEATLRDLIAAGLVEALVAMGKPSGYVVAVRFGSAERILGNARGAPKVFGSLDTVVTQLKRLGVEEFAVNASGYQPGLIRAPRPDRAEAMRRATKKSTKNSRDR